MEDFHKRIAGLVLRVLALAATLTAAIIMGTSKESANFYALSFEVNYNDTPAFKYFVIVNAVVSVYSFLALFVPSKSSFWRLIVALDLLVTLMLTSCISAALAIAQVGKNGNSITRWLPICNQVPDYCDRVTIALAAGFAAAILYLMVLAASAHAALDEDDCC
ncbi:hypothetical protein SAY86_027471 [Trapa natans]|uniref:CASP-like protein n=1 Tax=Trapa natans TaxID=22666 RepID=A0AAN7QJC4_TRANT|nr:hypothetical protein SAY86_027471 [Trapa natans]